MCRPRKLSARLDLDQKIFSLYKALLETTLIIILMPALHMEVGCPGTWGLELLTPNPGSKSTPKVCHTQHQPKHPFHRARSSVEIIITVITNNDNNNNDNNNNKVKIDKRERRVGENTKTLRKLIKMPQPLSTVKLRPHVTTHA